MIEISDENFKDAIAGARYVCVDFSAKWCGPCKSLAPRLNKIAEENHNVKICHADIEECADKVDEFHIMSVPTLLFFKDGEIQPELKIVGSVNDEKIRETLAKLTQDL